MMNAMKKLAAHMKRAPRAQGDNHAPSFEHGAVDQDDASLHYLADDDEVVNEVVHEHLDNHENEEEDESYDENMADDAYRERDKGESDEDDDDEDENHYDDHGGGGGGGDGDSGGHEEEGNDDEDRASGGDEDEWPEEEDFEEEGLEEGLSGQRAVEKTIELMWNGVKTIDLTKRYIGDEGGMALGEELGTNTLLVSLNLEKNGIHGEGGVAVAEALHQNSSLSTLSLKCNSIGVDGVIAFANALSVNITLCSLNLGSGWDEERNNIGDDGVLALVDALGENTVLTCLDLSFNGISEVGGKAIAGLLSSNTSLQILSLGFNEIGDSGAVGLGKGLGRNSSLTSLNLYNNHIGPDGAVGLGEGLGKNRSLTSLDLGFNGIGDSGAVGLGEGLGKNSSLTELNLGFNGIGDLGAVGLGEGLGMNRSLTSLNLYNNNISDSGAVGLGEGLGENRSLTSLNLGFNGISDSGAVGLGQGLGMNSSLTELNLGFNGIGDSGAVGLGEGLGMNSSLTSLNLYNNNIGDSGAVGLGEGLSENRSLTSLNLESNKIGDSGTVGLGKGLGKNRSLTSLNLGFNGIGDLGAVGLGNGLGMNSSLTSLNLERNQIGPDGAVGLGKGLGKNSSLTSLDLGYNGIGPNGAVGIGEGLGKNRSLASLNLAANRMGPDGAVGLGEGLGKNSSLTSLDLGFNGIGDSGAFGLGEGLGKNSSLTELNLERNNIGDSGAVGLGEGLGMNRSLTSLNLRDNKIGDDGAIGLGEGLGKNSSLTLLDLEENNIGASGEFALVSALLAQNCRLHELRGIRPLPSLSWTELLKLPTGGARIERILEFYLNEDGEKWTPAAHELAEEHADLFAVFLAALCVCYLPSVQKRLGKADLWLLRNEGAKDEEFSIEEKDSAVPLIHALFDCRTAKTEYSLSRWFCDEVLAKCLSLEDGLQLMIAEDEVGRSLRSLALTNKNTKKWAKTYGMYLDRYSIMEGPPVHESKTCAVHYATDIQRNEAVALKIMRRKDQYDREIVARTAADGGYANLEGCLPLLHREDKNFAKRLDEELCLVMTKGSRSLFEAINTERFAGRDLQKIRAIAYKIIIAVKGLHDSGRIHGDIKPRNVVRVAASKQHTFSYGEKGDRLEVSKEWRDNVTGERFVAACDDDWQLIDLDASAPINYEKVPTEKSVVTDKVSTGYAAPELAKWHFIHEAKEDMAPAADPAIDVWGFGVVLFQLLSGTKLFMVDESDDNLVTSREQTELMNWLGVDDERLHRIKLRESKDRGKADDLRATEFEIEAARDLVRLCLRGDPGERITVKQIIDEHPFFESIRTNTCEPSEEEEDINTRTPVRASSSIPPRFSRRVMSLHKAIIPRRFSLFGRTTKARLRRSTTPNKFYEQGAHSELIELPTYHFFLSHMQSQAAGIVKDLAAGLERHQLSSWIDMRASEITLESMYRGVLASRRFVMVLTKGVLFRPYCLAELYFAVEFFKTSSRYDDLEWNIFFIVEIDGRFDPWSEIDVPWREGTEAEGDQAARKASELQRALDDLGLKDWEGSLVKSEKILANAEVALKHCKKIPYRRRLYEEEAMLQALITRAGFDTLPPASSASSEELSIVVVGMANSRVTKELVKKLEKEHKKPNGNVTLFHNKSDAVEASSVVVVVLEQGCRHEVESALASNQLSTQPVLAIAVEDEWKFDDAHKGEFTSELQSRLFDRLEVLMWRSSPSIGNCDVGHEHSALIDELCSRARKARKVIVQGPAPE